MSNSQSILTINQHPGDSTTVTITGEKFKGDGYYGRSDGLHTAQFTYNGFTGTYVIEASLAVNPTDSDWFHVHSSVVENQTNSTIFNFTGNYVWIRAKLVNWTDGTLNSIVLNH
jgi:hypothetical protein